MDLKEGEVVIPRVPAPTEGEENPTAAVAADVARHGADEARRLGEALRERFIDEAERRRAVFASELGRIADRIDPGDSGDKSGLAKEAAGVARRFSRGLERYDTKYLVDQVDERFRKRPGSFLIGGLALGFLTARLLRS